MKGLVKTRRSPPAQAHHPQNSGHPPHRESPQLTRPRPHKQDAPQRRRADRAADRPPMAVCIHSHPTLCHSPGALMSPQLNDAARVLHDNSCNTPRSRLQAASMLPSHQPLCFAGQDYVMFRRQHRVWALVERLRAVRHRRDAAPVHAQTIRHRVNAMVMLLSTPPVKWQAFMLAQILATKRTVGCNNVLHSGG